MTGLTGKKVRLFWNDLGKVLLKIGVIVSEDVSYTQIKLEDGEVEAIPTCNVVRVEVLNGI